MFDQSVKSECKQCERPLPSHCVTIETRLTFLAPQGDRKGGNIQPFRIIERHKTELARRFQLCGGIRRQNSSGRVYNFKVVCLEIPHRLCGGERPSRASPTAPRRLGTPPAFG